MISTKFKKTSKTLDSRGVSSLKLFLGLGDEKTYKTENLEAGFKFFGFCSRTNGDIKKKQKIT